MFVLGLGSGVAQAQDVAPAPASAPAEEGSESPPPTPVEDELTKYRAPFGVLADRAIGTTSTPVEFDWRQNTVQIAATGSFLVELNNFNSLRAGALARVPSGPVMLEFGLSYARVWDTPSSDLLARTPYRQPGRPTRLDIDFAVGLPLAEGVVTTAPRWFPAVQLVFNAYAGVRYAVYPSGYRGLRAGQVASSILSPALLQDEIDNLDDARLDSMQVDPGRYGVLVGFGNDIYFKQGLFISPKLMVAVPLFAPTNGTNLLVWADCTLALGVAF